MRRLRRFAGPDGSIQVIAQEDVTSHAVRNSTGFGRTVGGVVVDGVAEQVHIQVTISVIIEPVGLGVETGKIQTVVGGGFGEGAVFVLQEEFVAAVEAFVAGDVADVQVHPPIGVHVHNTDTCRPVPCTCDPALLGCIAEGKITLVDVVFVLALVVGEVQVRQVIAIDVRSGHPTTVVVVEIFHDVPIFGFLKLVAARYSGVKAFLEERFLGAVAGAEEGN